MMYLKQVLSVVRNGILGLDLYACSIMSSHAYAESIDISY